MRQGFDNEKYIELQTEQIRKRIDQLGGKLYLEFGGKLFDDYHASRVLPGFESDTKFRMLQKLVDVGNTVVVIEHNLDVIKTADHIIDLGPEGGDGGGTIVATGTPEDIAACPASFTGQYLKKML